MEPSGPDFRFREAPPAFEDYQRFILEHYDAEEVPISAFSHSLDRMLRFNCFHSVDNRPRRSMDDFVAWHDSTFGAVTSRGQAVDGHVQLLCDLAFNDQTAQMVPLGDSKVSPFTGVFDGGGQIEIRIKRNGF